MEELSKTTTKTYYACRECKNKMQAISLGSSGDGLFGLTSKTNAFYCQHKECPRYGDLTVVGIKIEE